MTKDDEFKLLKIQTCVLKVNIHCDGCKQKVKKILQRIEGVYQVKVDSDQQRVTVSGSVDSATLIKKLVRAGKHAEVWSQKTTQSSKFKPNFVKHDKNTTTTNNNKGQKQPQMPFKSHKFQIPNSEEDDYDCLDDCLDDDDDDEDDDAYNELLLLEEKVNQMGLLKEKSMNGKNGGGKAIGGKKGNPNQKMGIKGNPNGGIDQKGMAAMKLNNPQMGVGNDINTLMGIAGFNGKGPNVNAIMGSGSSNVGGGNIPNGLGGFQFNPNTSVGGGIIQGPSSNMGMMNMNGFQQQYNNHPSALMNRQQPQPQMMYHRAPPMIPSNTGYYYNYDYSHVPPPHPSYCDPNQSAAAAHMFSDENTGSCSIM